MRIYLDDCICPDCTHCDLENDLCRVERWRYPTDGCFDFVNKETPDGDSALIQILGAIKGEEQ